jgi:hypothetical protein
VFLLTNEQRKYFALEPVKESWQFIKLEGRGASAYNSYIYVDGRVVRKLIQEGENYYCEYGLRETLSEDGAYILPKKENGKTVRLSPSSIASKKRVGMAFEYMHISKRPEFTLYSADTEQEYYCSFMKETPPKSVSETVEKWISESGEGYLDEIREFAERKHVNVKYKEGDFFRFRINRKLWGYGRLLLDFTKKSYPRLFMGKPIYVSIYHIATEDKNVDIDTLLTLKKFPTQLIQDNKLFYGEFEIIGNRPVDCANEDMPIHFIRNHWHMPNEEHKLYIGKEVYAAEDPRNIDLGYDMIGNKFSYIGIGFFLEIDEDAFLKCIEESSNTPYWQQTYFWVNDDLRNPKFIDIRREIFAEFGLDSEKFIKTDL